MNATLLSGISEELILAVAVGISVVSVLVHFISMFRSDSGVSLGRLSASVERASERFDEFVANTTVNRITARGEVIASQFKVFLEDVAGSINTVHNQQFLANTMSVFAAVRKLKVVPVLKTSFPRRLGKKQLTIKDVETMIGDTVKTGLISVEEALEVLSRQAELFLKDQKLTMTLDFAQLNMRQLISSIEDQHEEFNQFEPMHEDGLKRILKKEGVDVIPVEGLEVLAALVQYDDDQKRARHAILLKADGRLHQSLKEFILAHELGHWLAHIKGPEGRAIPNGHWAFLHSFHDVGPYENEAHKIALIALFPTPFLTWIDMLGPFNAEATLDKFVEGMGKLNRPLRDFWLLYIRRRLSTYRRFRELELTQIKLPSRPLQEEVAHVLTEYTLQDLAWARTDEKSIIVDANEQYTQMFGLDKKSFLDKRVHVVRTLTDPTDEKLRRQTTELLKTKKNESRLYFSKYRHLVTDEIFLVTVYSLPIVDAHGEYVGSLGIAAEARAGRERLWN